MYPPLESSPENNATTKENKSLRVNTPANLSQSKPVYSGTSQESPQNTDRMVSPKRKVEHFPHLYVANNVKTSTFSEQIDKNNLSSNKNNLINNHEYNSKYSCSHTPINMVPERDTGPNKVSPNSVSAVGSLKLPSSSQGVSKYNGEVSGTDEHRMVTSRPHHHVSVQELRLQVRFTLIS